MKDWPFFSASCRKDVSDILRGKTLTAYRANPSFGSGPSKGSWAERLERAVEKKFRVRHAVVVNSGTAALHLGLLAYGIRGKEVITTPYTFSATAGAIVLAGGQPVFADVSSDTYCLNPKEVRNVQTRKTVLALPVHLFGYFCDTSDYVRSGIPFAEDAAQAVGALREGVYSGSSGVFGAYSFNGSKNVPGGEGGCLVTNDGELAERARWWGNHGENFGRREPGYNYRMTEMTACVAWHGLNELGKRNETRRRLARLIPTEYWAWMKGFVRVNRAWFNGPSHVWYAKPVEIHPPGTSNAAKFRDAVWKKIRGCPVSKGYILPHLGEYPAFRDCVRRPLPVADRLSKETLLLFTGLVPGTTEERVVEMKEELERAITCVLSV